MTSSPFGQPPTIPLLSLIRPAIELSQALGQGDASESSDLLKLWHAVGKATNLIKDGERIEYLTWRLWGRSSRPPATRRLSTSSFESLSTDSIRTPLNEDLPILPPPSARPQGFGTALHLLLEDDSNFKDWVSDAKRNLPPPTLSVPDTPIANLEIHLVEPTPVPSRVGSYGGSLTNSGLLEPVKQPAKAPSSVKSGMEQHSWQQASSEEETSWQLAAQVKIPENTAKRKNKFFLPSSPVKGSSERSVPIHEYVDTSTRQPQNSSASDSSPQPTTVSAVKPPPAKGRLKNREPIKLSIPDTDEASPQPEKTEAEDHAAEDEDSGWEDEVEDAEEGDWSDEDDSGTSSKPSKAELLLKTELSERNIALALTRHSSRRASKGVPAAPAPTPLAKMSKEDRVAAAAERRRIEADLDAQRKREMFAKQQIFGKGPEQGLLSGMIKAGGSMVDLTKSRGSATDLLKTCTTHGDLAALHDRHEHPTIAPNLLRSKSALALPQPTGVSVTVSASKLRRSSTEDAEETHSQSSDEGEEEDNYLATSSIRKKLEKLAERQPRPPPSADLPVDEEGVAIAVSPTTRRRTMIMREMSESLRQNLILERVKSAGGQRRTSEPAIKTLPSSSAEDVEENQDQPPSTMNHPPVRRTGNNVLGGGFLRPLTRVGTGTELNRAQSSTQLAGDESSAWPPHRATPMMRSSTADSVSHQVMMHRETRKREMSKRGPIDSSYRAHGW